MDESTQYTRPPEYAQQISLLGCKREESVRNMIKSRGDIVLDMLSVRGDFRAKCYDRLARLKGDFFLTFWLNIGSLAVILAQFREHFVMMCYVSLLIMVACLWHSFRKAHEIFNEASSVIGIGNDGIYYNVGSKIKMIPRRSISRVEMGEGLLKIISGLNEVAFLSHQFPENAKDLIEKSLSLLASKE